MFVEVLGDVRNIEVRVAFVGELLEFGVERFLVTVRTSDINASGGGLAYPSEADLVTKVVKATDTILGILEIVVLDETEAEVSC
jgi:hypothetical protein